ncbi:hypothetical protein GCM10023211_21670 [Orbus sasakiae]|uniref:ATP-binding protein n=1 Tax=Orbus sasakiae TaxID=1078475 RepID=A0ABP9NEC9_9GAMM
MKKFVFKKDKKHWLRMVEKRNDRRKESKNDKHLSTIGSKSLYANSKKREKVIMPKIVAPRIMLLKVSEYYNQFINFINDFERLCKKANELKFRFELDLSHIKEMYGDACVLFIASVDSMYQLYPNLKIKIRKPIKDITSRYDPHAVFCHLGFYKLFGLEYSADCSSENVVCWRYVTGDLADGQLTEPLMKTLNDMGINTKELYRSCIEGIANAVEHAYIPQIKSSRDVRNKKWWMLLAKLDGKLLLFVYDRGHGIPSTLEYTQDQKILKEIWKKLKQLVSPTKDCLYIKASMLVKETRTELNYRGKGTGDIKSFIDKTEGNLLRIYSSRGTMIYKGESTPSFCYDNSISINGTLLQWSIKLQDTI